jgi:signal transduction histidine kinase
MGRFRLTLILIFLVILVPTVFLLFRSWEHLGAEATFGQKERAFLILQMLNQRIYDDLAVEERRSYSEYRFIRAVPMIGGEGVTLSDLAHYPVRSHYAGMIGYFQMEPDGSVRTPVLPDGLLEKIPIENRKEREGVRDRIKTVLVGMKFQNSVAHRRVTAYPYVYTFSADSLKNTKSGRDLQLNSVLAKGQPFAKRYETPSAKEAIVFDVESDRLSTGRQAVVVNGEQLAVEDQGSFDVEIEPFQARFNQDNLVFYRNVWRGDQRFLQGFVVDLKQYLRNMMYKELQISPEEMVLRLEFRSSTGALVSFCSTSSSGDLLFSSPLQFPLQDMELAAYMSMSGRPPGSGLIIVLGFTMVLVLSAGLYGVYKTTASQMRASAKRQDFISAVSHELKTPLTAIRMYAELLQNQWVVKEEKRQHYYTMIASETERLTRLIQNVLNISNLERHRWPVHLQLTNPRQFLEEFIVKYTPTVERAGFSLESIFEECEEEIYLDRDATYQMIMNLLENSIKFAKGFEPKKIQIGLRVRRDGMMIFVRDFGPGIPSAEKERVFQEFYRVENEMTRRTSGAGIGLSLVRKFSQLLNVRLELINANPGLRVEMHLPIQSSL